MIVLEYHQLSLRFKCEAEGNSGVFVHADFKPGTAAVSQGMQFEIDRTRGDYERWLDARYAAARGHCDAIIDPLETRGILSFALEASMQHATPASEGMRP